jgi:hypothetical protein
MPVRHQIGCRLLVRCCSGHYGTATHRRFRRSSGRNFGAAHGREHDARKGTRYRGYAWHEGSAHVDRRWNRHCAPRRLTARRRQELVGETIRRVCKGRREAMCVAVVEQRSAPVVCRRLHCSQPFVDPPPRGGAAVAQQRIALPLRAPDVRRVRLRLKLRQLVIDRLGVGGEANKFRVTLLVVHMDNITARDIRGKGVRSTTSVGCAFVARRTAGRQGSRLFASTDVRRAMSAHPALARAFPSVRVAPQVGSWANGLGTLGSGPVPDNRGCWLGGRDRGCRVEPDGVFGVARDDGVRASHVDSPCVAHRRPCPLRPARRSCRDPCGDGRRPRPLERR